MPSNKINNANKLDKIRAAAIYNVKKRFAEMEAKANEEKEMREIAEELTTSRQETVKKSVEAVSVKKEGK